jgi:hypothetical protein
MRDSKKVILKLIDDVGVVEASNTMGMSVQELLKFTKIPIDIETVDYLVKELYDDGLIPKKYKNCSIWYDSFVGTLEWECHWEHESETTYTYATPFWDSQNGIPVETNQYEVKEGENIRTLDESNIDVEYRYNFISWKKGFENYDSLKFWLENFYLPKVYDVIVGHLDNYRLTDNAPF